MTTTMTDPDLLRIVRIVREDIATLVAASRLLDITRESLATMQNEGGGVRVLAASVASLAATVWQQSTTIAAVADDLRVSLGDETRVMFGALSQPLARFASAVSALDDIRGGLGEPDDERVAARYHRAIDDYETALVGLGIALHIDGTMGAHDRRAPMSDLSDTSRIVANRR